MLLLTSITHSYAGHLSGIVTDAVHSKTVGAFAAMKGLRNHAKKHTGIPLWPTDYGQLLPRGLADLARGYADVISVCHGFSNIAQNVYRWEDPLLLFGKLIALCDRPIVPHLLGCGLECSAAMWYPATQAQDEIKAAEGKIVDRRSELTRMAHGYDLGARVILRRYYRHRGTRLHRPLHTRLSKSVTFPR